jgi:hypothetical protein
MGCTLVQFETVKTKEATYRYRRNNDGHPLQPSEVLDLVVIN